MFNHHVIIGSTYFINVLVNVVMIFFSFTPIFFLGFEHVLHFLPLFTTFRCPIEFFFLKSYRKLVEFFENSHYKTAFLVIARLQQSNVLKVSRQLLSKQFICKKKPKSTKLRMVLPKKLHEQDFSDTHPFCTEA